MTGWASICAAAIGLNGAIFVIGRLWMRRQVRRVAQEHKAEYRALFIRATLPPPGEDVELLIEDGLGALSTCAAWHLLHLGWIDATTLLPVAETPVGWRRHPFRASPPNDLATWSSERLQEALARLAPEDELPDGSG